MLFIQHPLSPLTAGGRREAHFLRRDEGEDDADNNDNNDEWVTASVLLSSHFSSRGVHVDSCGDDLLLPFLLVLWISCSREAEWVWVDAQPGLITASN